MNVFICRCSNVYSGISILKLVSHHVVHYSVLAVNQTLIAHHNHMSLQHLPINTHSIPLTLNFHRPRRSPNPNLTPFLQITTSSLLLGEQHPHLTFLPTSLRSSIQLRHKRSSTSDLLHPSFDHKVLTPHISLSASSLSGGLTRFHDPLLYCCSQAARDEFLAPSVRREGFW
jgi:hypothetical protein